MLLSWRFPREKKNRFGRFSSLPPMPPPHRRVKQVRFGKLAFLQLNGVIFSLENVHFRPFRTTFSSNWHFGVETVQIFELIVLKALIFCTEKMQNIPHRTKRASRPPIAQKWAKLFHWKLSAKQPKISFFGPKMAPFCCKSANLSNRACFTRIPPPPQKMLILFLLSSRRLWLNLRVKTIDRANRFPALFCENLRFSAKICGSCALQMLAFPGKGVNLQKSVVFCEHLRFGLSLSP